MKVLVIGKDGQLGQSLHRLATEFSPLSFEFVGREQLDLACAASVERFFMQLAQPYAGIINAAAYTAVDKAETEVQLAYQVNHLAVRQLAQLAQQQGSYLLHVSTDYVFAGTGYRPYRETDKPAPVNQYGHSKLAGELALLASGCRGAIVRTSWVYSEFANNFVKTMLRLGRGREQLSVVCDQVGTPTCAGDLARALLVLLHNELGGLTEQKAQVQTYHYSNEGVCSWYDFACEIFSLSGIACHVRPIATCEYPTPAARPHYSLLNKALIRQQPGIQIPYWRDSLRTCLQRIG